MLVNVLWQWYLPGGRLEKNSLLNEVHAYFMGKKSTRNGIYMCGQKDKICVGLVNRCEYLCHKWPRICFVCRNHNPVLHSRFFTGFVTIVPRCVPLVEQELLTLKKHMSSPLVFVRFMLLNLISCVAFCGSLFVLSFGHYMVCLSTNGLWVVLRYLKTVLTSLTLYICLYWTLFYIEKQ